MKRILLVIGVLHAVLYVNAQSGSTLHYRGETTGDEASVVVAEEYIYAGGCSVQDETTIEDTVIFKAGKSIIMNPGFVVNQGAVFQATIDSGSEKSSYSSSKAQSAELYPNPTEAEITVSHSPEIKKVTLYSSLGLIINSKQNEGNSETKFDLSGYSSGIYFIQTDNEPLQKVIKK